MTDAALARLLLAFEGTDLPEPMRHRLGSRPAAGVSLFRYRNVSSPAQVRALTDAIQALAPADLPFLVAMDQEGGQLLGLGNGSTPFAGNMALGAAGDAWLTRRVGEAIGRELRAVGVNVNYAPVADLATNPANPSLGVRSFGDDPSAVAGHVAAFVEGLEAAGVAATLKHFPGKGDAGVDTHHELATVEASAETFRERELTTFRAGMASGASAIMSGHFAAPSLGTGEMPATLAPTVLRDLLRDELGFGGVAISDAFDMDALAPGDGRIGAAVTALNAGIDLLLLGPRSDVTTFDNGVLRAAAAGELEAEPGRAAIARIEALRRRLGAVAEVPGLEVVGGAEHRILAREIAERSLTLVRDQDGLLPLRSPSTERLLVVMPRPVDRTPADTSSTVVPALSASLQRHVAEVREMLVSAEPTGEEIAEAVTAARGATTVVVGTIGASFAPSQAELASALLRTGVPTITAALRTPWDLDAYPEAGTHVCTYSILEPSLVALADAIVGRIGFAGKLPVRSRVAA